MLQNNVFLSYTRTDDQFVLKLANDLRQAGADIWIDQLDIPAGSRWEKEVEKALINAECLLVVLSPVSASSDNVSDEIAYAIDNKKRIIPIIYKACSVPFRIRSLQFIDFTKDYTLALNRLMKELGIKPPEPVPEPIPVPEPPPPKPGPDPKPSPWWKNKKMWVWAFVALFVCSIVLVWLSGVWRPDREQYKLANDIAERHHFFSLGNESWSNPNAASEENKFHVMQDVLFQDWTGLTWQKGGSEDISFDDIPSYIRKLNEAKIAGYSDWRLPTLAEAWSLLYSRKSSAGLYIDPSFDMKQRFIFTGTITPKGYGWFIFFEYGFPIFQNARQSHGFVRAVRGPEFK
jgi:TIR domain/Protein of unknown function (DUF1566)